MAVPPGGWVGAIDQGTTSTRFFLYDEKLNVVGAHQMEFTQIHPQAGWDTHPCHTLTTTLAHTSSQAHFHPTGHLQTHTPAPQRTHDSAGLLCF